MRRTLSPQWTEQDVLKLTEMVGNGEPAWRMARRLRRTESAVRSKMVALGLQLAPNTLTLRRMRKAVFNTPSSY